MGSFRKTCYKEKVCKKHSMLDGNQARYNSMINENQTQQQKEIFYRKPYGKMGEKHKGLLTSSEDRIRK